MECTTAKRVERRGGWVAILITPPPHPPPHMKVYIAIAFALLSFSSVHSLPAPKSSLSQTFPGRPFSSSSPSLPPLHLPPHGGTIAASSPSQSSRLKNIGARSSTAVFLVAALIATVKVGGQQGLSLIMCLSQLLIFKEGTALTINPEAEKVRARAKRAESTSEFMCERS